MENDSAPDPSAPDPTMDDASIDAVASILAPADRRIFLARARPAPGPAESRTFAADLCLAFGAVFAGAAIIFFFAANWQGMDRFTKLGSLAAAFLLTAGAAWWNDVNRPVGTAFQTVATLIFGSLLAVYGQIYQTGADSWELFFWWALLLTPWTLLSRRPLPWLFSLGLFNLALLFYFDQVAHWKDPAPFALASAALTGTAWLAWEHLARGRAPWLGLVLGPRVLACATFGALIGPAVQFVLFKNDAGSSLVFSVLVALIAFTLTTYRRLAPGIFAPAVALAALLTLSTAFLSEIVESIFDFDLAYVLALGLILVAKISAAVWWLRRLSESTAPEPELLPSPAPTADGGER